MTSTIRIQVRGLRDEIAMVRPPLGEPFADVVKSRVKDAVRIDRARAELAPILTSAIEDDDVVEVALEDGLKLWLRGSELEAELGVTRKRDAGANADIVELPEALPRRNLQRGLGTWLLKGLRIIDVDPAAATARMVAERLEQKLVPQPGLHRWTNARELVPATDRDVRGQSKLLLFLHGTASKTLGSFGGLAEDARQREWLAIQVAYGDRIFALEHKTLSVSPIENAIEALEALPDNATLHIVSHSRGGLVGELLCRGHLVGRDEAFTVEELALLEASGQSQQLAHLGELLQTKRPMVERFVRVACPARGTILASERLDRYLSVLSNLLELVPGLAGNPIHDFVKAFLFAVIKQRTDPGTIPGLEAMMPESAFQKLINRPQVTASADLSVIKGDLEGEGIFSLSRLKALATDLYYREDHDLVVNTSAMDGGTPRQQGVRVFFDRGPMVDHFGYFRNERTAAQLVRGLLRRDDDLAGFEPLVEKVERAIPRGAIFTRGDRKPAAFVLPGLTGTLLDALGQRVWINVLQLAFGGLARLEITDHSIEPTGLVSLYYADLIEHLSATHTVIPFPFDWRRSIWDEGARFAEALDERLQETDQPVRIVAHSLGGLVARAALAQSNRTWERFKERDGSRIVLLGVPNGGSHSIPMLLMGRDQTMKMLAALDFKMTRREHLAIVSHYPGLLELLPRDGSLELFKASGWAELQAHDGGGADQWIVPLVDRLAQAAEVRLKLDAAPVDVERMLYVAGQNVTVDGITIDRQRRRVAFTRTNEGDGRVPWRSGILPGMRAWYTDAAHGDLARHRPAFPAIVDLLERGTTTKLPSTPPATRDTEAPLPIDAERMEIFPDAQDLMAASMGGRITRPAAAHVEPMRLAVTHGNLAFARYPLVVGHYRGDTFAGAEAHLDLMLDGRLTRWRELGLYPNAIGTAEVIIDSAADHPRGAIVVGLGDANRLSEGELERTLTRGFLRYAAVEREKRSTGFVYRGAGRIGVSCLLVGSGEGGLSIGACVTALLKALKFAQRALGDRGFDEIEVIELYEHRAIQIWHEIEQVRRTPGLMDQFLTETEVRRGEGGRRRVAEKEDRSWWQPVNIAMEQSGRDEARMTFTVATGMARAEAAILPTQKAFVDRFIRQAIAHAYVDPERGSPGRTLFELLVPEHLKERMRDDRPLRLILDPESAAYPWELMDDRRPWVDGGAPGAASDRDPPAMRAGLIRQLVRHSFRERIMSPGGRTKAIVIGDPRGDPTGHYAPLDGAIEEAHAVADLLDSRGFEVMRLIGEEVTADQAVMALCAQDWRIVHIAAHGIVAKDEGEATGVVLGRDMILNAAMLGQLLPVTPDLVFVNCCHLGALDPALDERAQPYALAANLAVKLIDIGVSAVVAAGWAVDDRPAQRFAETFYNAILDNKTFGNAVLGARQETYASARGSTTWGAYQCYGEPDWRLDVRSPDGQFREPVFGSIVEAINAIDEICQDAQTGMARDMAHLKVRLTDIRKIAAERTWDREPELLTALGRAHGELGNLSEAIGMYEAALGCERGAIPLSTIEQLANLTVRNALREPRSSDDTKAVDGLVRKQIKRLDQLEQLAGSSVERFALKGGCLKRLAQIVRGEARTKALLEMADAYEKAEALARERTGKIDPYPCLMVVTANVANRWRQSGKGNLKKLRRLIADAERATVERDRADPRFWHGAHKADALLLSQLADGNLSTDQQSKIMNAYFDAWRRGGSRLKLSSVLEQFEFFIDVWRDEKDEQHRAKRAELVQALGALRESVAAGTRRNK